METKKKKQFQKPQIRTIMTEIVAAAPVASEGIGGTSYNSISNVQFFNLQA